jgi:hypothetical protein
MSNKSKLFINRKSISHFRMKNTKSVRVVQHSRILLRGWRANCNIKLLLYKPRWALPRRHLCTFRILILYYFVLYIMSFRHSTISPFRHSAISPFRHSVILPFRHSAPIRNNAMYVSQEVLRKAVTLPGGLWSNRYVPPLHAK